jgi:hypothetical protein
MRFLGTIGQIWPAELYEWDYDRIAAKGLQSNGPGMFRWHPRDPSGEETALLCESISRSFEFFPNF